MILDDLQQPWDQQSGEPNDLYNRFRRYLMLVGKRSLLAAYNSERGEKGLKKATGCPENWWNAFKEWRWKERAAAWDTHQDALEFEEWQYRRKLTRDREWECSEALYHKAQQMLQVSLEDTKWTMRDIATFFETSSTLARKASGMDQDPMQKQQLNMCYDLLRRLLLLEDSTTAFAVKDLVRAHLDALLLQLGKPVPEVIAVLKQPEEEY